MDENKFFLYDPVKIGARIRMLRQLWGISQKTLADQLQLSRVQLSKGENGQEGFSPENMMRIAQFFDVNLDYLYFGRTRDAEFRKQMLTIADLIYVLCSGESKKGAKVKWYVEQSYDDSGSNEDDQPKQAACLSAEKGG